ncbi:MAG: hypothetical protein Q9219_002118 [cf. Caloplaca sp. 3 TL-2023]
MESYASSSRAARPRQPLADTTNWVNNQSSTPSRHPLDANASSPPSLPHHESLKPGGTLQARNIALDPSQPAVVDKRLSAISGEEKRNANRDSQISTASSTTSGISRRRKTHVGPWQLGKTIGKGSSGRVRKARHAVTGQEAAIKIVSKRVATHLRTASLAHMEKLLPAGNRGKRMIPFGIEREVVIMKLIEHPNIIRLYDVWENRGELYLVLEYIEGGELFDHINSVGRLPEHEAIRIFRQIIAGISYCHRFNICHRDLKPENILLDKNQNIKIVDFGMAALQPANGALKTSCGSPHYASPEVIQAIPYKGDKADIWSCGVILYAMLAGCLPFDSHGDWSDVVNTVLRGEYEFPEDMSAYAQDLIHRMLQMDPKRRIPIKEMWLHPLIQNYQKLDPLDAEGLPYIGPPAPLTFADCGEPIKSQDDIDVELLGNLQNLYHGVPEDVLVELLLSEGPNYEKVLYTKLLRYREEQLEDYQGPTIEYSASDYHHKPKHEKPPPMPRRSSTRTSLKPSSIQYGKTQSRYSILVEEGPRRGISHRRPSMSSQQRPPSSARQRAPSVAESEGSYDPFRSSRAQFHKPQADHTRIIVLRGLSNRNTGNRQSLSSLNPRVPSKASSQRPAPLQSPVEDQFSIVSTPPASHSSQLVRLRNERRFSRASSRHTISSSTGTRIVHKSASYRRGVSFTHARKRSVSADIPSSRYSSSVARRAIQLSRARPSSPPLPSIPLSPPETPPPPGPASTVRSKKPLPGEDGARRSRITSQYWKEETRKVSKELENFCDEAFNRDSVASSVPTTTATATTDGRSYGTPATSGSIYGSIPMPSGIARRVPNPSDLKAYENRPLPQPPIQESVDSLTQRQLAETKKVLLNQARTQGFGIDKACFEELIKHIDRLMQPSQVRLEEENRRAVSTPEQGLAPNKDTFERFLERANVGVRSVSDPATEHQSRQQRRQANTIRIVDDRDDQGYVSPVKPLAIRKKSSSTTPSTETLRKRSSHEQLPQTSDLRQHDRYQPAERGSTGLDPMQKSLEPIVEQTDDRMNEEPKPRVVTKKKSWFFRGHQANTSQESGQMPPPPLPPKDQVEKGFQNFGGRKEVPVWKRASDPKSEASQNSDSKEGTMGKSRFLKLFGKKDKDERSKRSSQELKSDFGLENDASFHTTSTASHQPYMMSGALPSQSSTSVAARQRNNQQPYSKADQNKSSLSFAPPPAVAAREIEPQHQNWLMKLLGFRPAMTVMAFQVSRARARKEIVCVFKEWKKYGMRDIVVDKAAGRMWARVGVKNSLHIRPVSLAVEVFTVLEHGRKANLAVVRFTQEKGAKSSFERVVKTLEQVLDEKGLLVEDRKRAMAIKGILM